MIVNVALIWLYFDFLLHICLVLKAIHCEIE